MPDSADHDHLEYFIEHVRLLLEGKTMEGLDVWARRFSDLRQESEFELCQWLVNAIRTCELPGYGLGVVRYAEGWLFDRMGEWQRAILAYEASDEEFEKSGVPLKATLQTQIGSIYQDQGRWDRAQSSYEHALESAPDEHTKGLVLNNLGNLALARDQFTTAEAYFGQARELLREIDERNFAAASHGLATVAMSLGNYQRAQDMHVECLTAFQSLGDAFGMGSAIGGIATVHLYAEKYPAAIHNYEAALQIFVEIDPAATAKTLGNLALAHQELARTEGGDYGAALDYLDEALAGYREVGDRHGEAAGLVNQARLHNLRGDSAAAEESAEAAKNYCTTYGFESELRRLPPDLR
ncbi:tetratricopeptide repeat protein [Nocardia sp. NPDC005978]|uniref:tetratricopeptide repeat protein n=1 Tax=Nocardia sp. NPDC005978 TaxID=3156725 RepID=UPI00339EFD48